MHMRPHQSLLKARFILAIHTMIFISLVCGSFALPFLIYQYPDIFVGKYVVITMGVLALLVVSSWPLYGGCPFTIWENTFKKEAGQPSYSGPCIDHYAALWFGIHLPPRVSTGMLIVLLALPIIAGATHW